MTEHVKIYGIKPRIQYVADGTSETYEFPFAIFSTSDIEKGDIVVYYYNNSLLLGGESNTLEHVLNGLTTSYLYQASKEGDLMILTNDEDMTKMPPYLEGKSSENGDEVVFVGGRSLNDVKHYANTIEFIWGNYGHCRDIWKFRPRLFLWIWR